MVSINLVCLLFKHKWQLRGDNDGYFMWCKRCGEIREIEKEDKDEDDKIVKNYGKSPFCGT